MAYTLTVLRGAAGEGATGLGGTARRNSKGVVMNGFTGFQRYLSIGATGAITAALFSACISTTTSSDDDDGGTGKTPETAYVGANGVAITEVAIYQGVKRVLAQAGAPVASNVPLVAGRNALVRAFYTAPPERIGQTVRGRLWLDGVAEPIETDVVLTGTSNDRDLNTSANFNVPGELIGATFGYRVELLDEQVEGVSDNPSAHHPVEGIEAHPVDGPVNTFRLVLAPFRYDADGSGRLPDLSPEAIETYKNRFLQLYPVSNVEVTVREPVAWSNAIQPNGQGWQEVGITLSGFRSQDGASADVYYYGIFNPAASFGQFCGFGCLLGVTLLNDQPADTGNPGLRLALGVGFAEVATDTAAHELGHSHGREHAPCGDGLDPQSIDTSYPHGGGSIGVWGWDIVSGQLVDPSLHTDIMGYCDRQWISDHNFAALLARGKNVNLPRLHEGVHEDGAFTATAEHTIAAFDGFGKTTWTTQPMARPIGKPTLATAITAAGPTMVEGHFFRYDHLPGGWFVFPKRDVRVERIELSVDGAFVAIDR